MNDKKVRVRFAPSPTGFLHVGGLRTALFNFLFARKNQGAFILRIEDTDKSREVAGAVENIVETLKLFGLNFDEGPIFQSQRLSIYNEHIEQLLKKGAAYKCYCSEERIVELKRQAELNKIPFRYDKNCLTSPTTSPGSATLPIPGEGKYVIRQNIPEEGSTEFEDVVYGKIKIENRTLDDGVLLKSDGYPVYNFANVVDDHLMKISHVIRGEEFIASTPKHILLYRAYGWDLPQFVHLPLLLDTKRKKLSKRSGDVAVSEYTGKGYLPEAILNFIALLGWNPKTEQEIFPLEELNQAFDLSKINRSGAIFDLQKLDFINRQWQKRLNLDPQDDPLFRVALTKLKDEQILTLIWTEILERIKGPSELLTKLYEFEFYFRDPEYDKELLRWKQVPDADIKTSLEKSLELVNLNYKPRMPKSEIEKIFLDEIGDGDKGLMLWPLRVAMAGLKNSPGPFDIMAVFASLPSGRETILNRIKKAIDKL